MLWVFFLQVFTKFGEISAIPGETDGNVVHFIFYAELYDIVFIVSADSG